MKDLSLLNKHPLDMFIYEIPIGIQEVPIEHQLSEDIIFDCPYTDALQRIEEFGDVDDIYMILLRHNVDQLGMIYRFYTGVVWIFLYID